MRNSKANKSRMQVYCALKSFLIFLFILFSSQLTNAQNISYISVYDYSKVSGYNASSSSPCSYNSSLCESTNLDVGLSLITGGIMVIVKSAIGIVTFIITSLLNIILMFLVNAFIM